MIDQPWRSVWGRRRLNEYGSIHEQLIRANGFDQGAGKVDADLYTEFVHKFSKLINLATSETLFEVGCGSGAFLYPLNKNTVGGLDFSLPLIEIAKKFLPHGSFICDEATNLDTAEKYDHVFAHSVFQYLSIDQAETVLTKMIAKASKTVSILDIPNKAKQDQQETVRKQSIGEELYKSKYQDLLHTYYPTQFFLKFPELIKLKNIILKESVMNYESNDFRFGIVFYL